MALAVVGDMPFGRRSCVTLGPESARRLLADVEPPRFQFEEVRLRQSCGDDFMESMQRPVSRLDGGESTAWRRMPDATRGARLAWSVVAFADLLAASGVHRRGAYARRGLGLGSALAVPGGAASGAPLAVAVAVAVSVSVSVSVSVAFTTFAAFAPASTAPGVAAVPIAVAVAVARIGECGMAEAAPIGRPRANDQECKPSGDRDDQRPEPQAHRS